MSDPIPYRDKQGNEFLLRRYSTWDRDGLLAMYDAFEPKRIAQGLPPGDPEPRRRWLDTVLSDGWHLVVVVDGVVVGHGMILPFEVDSAELANFIHQSMRDRGIGTVLNRALLEEAARAGIRRVWLSVEPSNRRAIRSYEKVGFRRTPGSGWGPEIEMEVILQTPEG